MEFELNDELYKKLYYHAFNRLTDLIQEVQAMQAELEEMYLKLLEDTRYPGEETDL